MSVEALSFYIFSEMTSVR